MTDRPDTTGEPRPRGGVWEVLFLREWREHRWGSVVCLGVLLAYGLDKLIKVGLTLLPFSPYYQLRHQFLEVVTKLAFGQKAAELPLLHQLALYNYTIDYVIALLVGVFVGALLTRRVALAGFVAFLPAWILKEVMAAFGRNLISELSSTIASVDPSHGSTAVQWSLFPVHHLISLPALAVAALAALLTRKALDARAARRAAAPAVE
ncbi:MAG: hypothetical protein ACYC7E_22250 [Armatimonadota bacterium]